MTRDLVTKFVSIGARATFVAAAALSVACHDSTGTGPNATLTVLNQSTAVTVTAVYIARTSGPAGWGLSWLSSDVEPGKVESIDFPPDTYNISIEAASNPQSPLQIFAEYMADASELKAVVTDKTMAFVP